jgi:hypothetical protein
MWEVASPLPHWISYSIRGGVYLERKRIPSSSPRKVSGYI